MRMSTIFLSVLLFLSCQYAVAKESKIQVVTTLPYLKDLTEKIGVGHVHVQSLASPRQDAHFVQPRPTLMKKVAKADLFIENGLSLELWSQKVVDSSGNSKVHVGQKGRLVASKGVAALEVPLELTRDLGDVHPEGNPHVWLDPINIKIIAANIKEALVKVDPAHKNDYEKNFKNYERQIDIFLFGEDLVKKVGSKKLTRLCLQNDLFNFLEKKKLMGSLGGWLKKSLPLRNIEVISYHKTWAYLANRLGFKVPLEIEDKPGISPTPKHRDEVVSKMKLSKIRVILMEIYYDRFPAADYIAKKTGATIVQVPIDVGMTAKTGDYLKLMDHIVEEMLAAVKINTSKTQAVKKKS